MESMSNSLVVTVELRASGGGTWRRTTESAVREMGRDVGVVELQYQDRVSGRASYLPRVAPHAATAGVRRSAPRRRRR